MTYHQAKKIKLEPMDSSEPSFNAGLSNHILCLSRDKIDSQRITIEDLKKQIKSLKFENQKRKKNESHLTKLLKIETEKKRMYKNICNSLASKPNVIVMADNKSVEKIKTPSKTSSNDTFGSGFNSLSYRIKQEKLDENEYIRPPLKSLYNDLPPMKQIKVVATRIALFDYKMVELNNKLSYNEKIFNDMEFQKYAIKAVTIQPKVLVKKINLEHILSIHKNNK